MVFNDNTISIFCREESKTAQKNQYTVIPIEFINEWVAKRVRRPIQNLYAIIFSTFESL